MLVTVAAAAVTIAAWADAAADGAAAPTKSTPCGPHERHHRNSRLVTLSVLTLIGVTGHFISYTFIVVIIRDVVGVHGPQLAWLLAGFGIAGLLGMAVMARPLDRHPKASVVGCLAALAAAFAVLTALASRQTSRGHDDRGRRRGDRSVGRGVDGAVADVAGRGDAHRARRPRRGVRSLRHGVPGRNHGRFAVSAGCSTNRPELAMMIGASTVLMAVALGGVAATRGLFGVRPGNQQEVTFDTLSR